MSIKEKSWKMLKGWQKGGLLLGLFGSLWGNVYFYTVLSRTIENSPFFYRTILTFTSSPTFLIVIFLNPTTLGIENKIVFSIITGILSFIPYFILGSAIGELYDEYKHGFKLGPAIISFLVLIGYVLFSSFFVLVSYLN